MDFINISAIKLRYHSVVPIIFRRPKEDIVLGGYHIPKDVNIYLLF